MSINIEIDTSQIPDFDNLDPERGGLPSASAGERLANCPGSWRMERNQPDLERYRIYAEHGSNVHAAWAGEVEVSTLTREERVDLDAANEAVGALVDDWNPDPKSPKGLVGREERHWLRAGLVPVTSGKTDRVYSNGNHFLIADLKTGWADYPLPSANIQLRIYALLLWDQHPEAESVTVALVRPTNRKPISFTYGKADLHAALFWWTQALKAIFSAEAPIIPGDHCQFCKAQLTCNARLQQVAAFTTLTTKTVTWASLTQEQKGALFVSWKSVEKFGDELAKRVKEELSNGITIPGIRLGTGRKQRAIEDAPKAFERVSNYITREEFFECSKVSYAQLREAVGDKCGLQKKERDAKIQAVLGELVTETTTEGSVEIV